MQEELKAFRIGRHWLAIPAEHYDEAIKLLTSGGVFSLQDIKTRFPGIEELPTPPAYAYAQQHEPRSQ